MIHRKTLAVLGACGILLNACGSAPVAGGFAGFPPAQEGGASAGTGSTPAPTHVPYRPNFAPGQLVDYTAQPGDSVAALAAHFNTTVAEIMAANPIIPATATTMPPGMPMKIPIYYKSLWGNPFHIMPDSQFVDGPPQTGFNTSAFVASHPGWWAYYHTWAGTQDRTGAEIVDYVALSYSVSPRLLLALLEFYSGALSNPKPPDKKYILDQPQPLFAEATNLDYLQLISVTNTLNNGYYGWRTGKLTEFYEPDGTILRPDPWQDAATVALQYLFSRTMSGPQFDAAIGPDGFYKTYAALFGDPFANDTPLIPGSLQQPPLLLPFPARQIWTYTGGPHTGWGIGDPLSAVDFAPPCDHPGCASLSPTSFSVAMADGLVVRSGVDGVALDLDGDGNERTGWVIFYMHLATGSRPAVGQEMHAGDSMGYPSSEGGEATGTHVHVARKYNGEWMPADGAVPFDMDGWIAHVGSAPYLGTLTQNGLTVKACTCSDLYSEVQVLP